MKHNFYSISDAAKKLNVEAHVLRYWEDELNLTIPRNELGHRIYSQNELETFTQIRNYKEEGLSLFEIRKLINPPGRTVPVNTSQSPSTEEKADKLGQFRLIMDSIICQAIEKNNEKLASIISENTSERVIKEMNYLFRTFDEDENVRIEQLRAAICASSYVKNEIAATKVKSKKWRKLGKKSNIV